MSTSYRVYGNDSMGGPVDYSTPIATIASLTYAPAALATPSDNRFAVRAFDTVSGLEEQNVDAVVRIVISPTGTDITDLPNAPVGLRVTATAGGGALVEWLYPYLSPSHRPTSFHVYRGAAGGGAPSYVTPAATVLAGIGPAYRATLSGLTDGAVYAVGVRSVNASGEEANTVTMPVTASVTPPPNVDGLVSSTV